MAFEMSMHDIVDCLKANSMKTEAFLFFCAPSLDWILSFELII